MHSYQRTAVLRRVLLVLGLSVMSLAYAADEPVEAAGKARFMESCEGTRVSLVAHG